MLNQTTAQQKRDEIRRDNDLLQHELDVIDGRALGRAPHMSHS